MYRNLLKAGRTPCVARGLGCGTFGGIGGATNVAAASVKETAGVALNTGYLQRRLTARLERPGSRLVAMVMAHALCDRDAGAEIGRGLCGVRRGVLNALAGAAWGRANCWQRWSKPNARARAVAHGAPIWACGRGLARALAGTPAGTTP